MKLWIGAIVAMIVFGACSAEPASTADTLPFVDRIELPSETPVLAMTSDGVALEVYDEGECAIVIEHVPEYGYLIDDFCPGPPIADPAGARFQTPNCPITDFGDECERWLPTFTIGHTVLEASFVCLASGRVEVVDGWWLAVDEDGHEAFPLNGDGVRLDSVSNEFDDAMRRRCEASDPELTSSLLEIRPTGYELPVTVELDMGVSGSFLLASGFEPFVFEAQLPLAGAPIGIVVFEGADGSSIGQVAVPESPECVDPVFVLDLSGPTGEWSCRG